MTRNEVIQIVRKTLADAGLSRVAIAGAMARIASESSFDPTAIRKNDAGPGKHSRGLFQWNRERLTGLERFAKAEGKSMYDPAVQAKYFVAELHGSESKYGQKLLNASNPRDAARAAISLARPGGWSARNPEGGHGFSNTLRLTKQFAAGNFGGQLGGKRSDTGATTRYSDAYNSGAEPGSTVDDSILNVVSDTLNAAKPNNDSGKREGQFGPEVPEGFVWANDDSDGAPDKPSGTAESEPEGRFENILTGLSVALTEGFKDMWADMDSKPVRKSGLRSEISSGTRSSPMVRSIRAMISV